MKIPAIMVKNNKNIFSNKTCSIQHMFILTAAISDETSVYKTPPEVQKSEVVSKTRASFSVFACSSTKAL